MAFRKGSYREAVSFNSTGTHGLRDTAWGYKVEYHV